MLRSRVMKRRGFMPCSLVQDHVQKIYFEINLSRKYYYLKMAVSRFGGEQTSVSRSRNALRARMRLWL